MQIIDAPVEATAVNPYTEDVAALIAAGEGKAGAISVPKDEANKARVKFAKAANAADKTARLISNDADTETEGNVLLVFKLTHKHAQRRGKPAETETETAAEVAPAEDAPAETPTRTRKR